MGKLRDQREDVAARVRKDAGKGVPLRELVQALASEVERQSAIIERLKRRGTRPRSR